MFKEISVVYSPAVPSTVEFIEIEASHILPGMGIKHP